MRERSRFWKQWGDSVGEVKQGALAGKRIVVTRALAQSETLVLALRTCGAEVLVFPLIKISPPRDHEALDDGLKSLRAGDWILFTSQNAVGPVAEQSERVCAGLLAENAGIRIAAVGPATEGAAADAGLRVHYAAKSHDGVSLVRELGERLRGRRVLLPRSDRAGAELPAAVRSVGGEPVEAVAYRTESAAAGNEDALAMISAGEVDAVVCFSPSAVQELVKLLGPDGGAKLHGVTVFTAIGEITAKAYREAGVREVVIAEDASVDGTVRVLNDHFANGERKVLAGAKKS